ncbi:MAG TPA: hypothetical protein VHK91_05505 [Flavisolibacter sp.]|jgi:hypothetical protein|nr:hypothetical protein [Flavisolibacter sp.]
MTAQSYRYLLCLGIFLYSNLFLNAQAITDTVAGGPLPQFMRDQYKSRLGGSASIYNGTEYTSTYPETKGSPFFHELGFTEGSIIYDGTYYPQIPLLYDLASASLCTKGLQGQALRLLPSKISRFTIDGHQFLSISEPDKSLPEGFYDILFEKMAVSFLVSRKKVPVRGLSTEEPYHFSTYQSYFIRKDSSYTEINSKNDFLSLFPEVRKELKKHWSDQKLDFKKEPEAAIVESLVYYYSKLKAGL